MPTVLRIHGFRFFFYSNEGNEPPHIHVEKGDANGKYWLEPISTAYSYRFTPAELRKIEQILFERKGSFKQKWYEYFGF